MRLETNPLRSAEERGTRSTILGISVNLGLALAKCSAGLLGNSFALVADGLESITDVISGLVVYFSLKIAVKPPDADHPYGHGKAEPIAAAVVSLALMAGRARPDERLSYQDQCRWCVVSWEASSTSYNRSVGSVKAADHPISYLPRFSVSCLPTILGRISRRTPSRFSFRVRMDLRTCRPPRCWHTYWHVFQRSVPIGMYD
jgi:Cation efflux family